MLTKLNKTIHKISDGKFIGDIKSVLGRKTITTSAKHATTFLVKLNVLLGFYGKK